MHILFRWSVAGRGRRSRHSRVVAAALATFGLTATACDGPADTGGAPPPALLEPSEAPSSKAPAPRGGRAEKARSPQRRPAEYLDPRIGK